MRSLASFIVLLLTSATVISAAPLELKGSRASMERQHRIALAGGYTFARTFEDIDRMLASGELVELNGNGDYELHPGVSVKAARPEVRLFIERLAAEYHAATGEKLVVTSLTRPGISQPANASALSVHPTGMSIDLRVSQLEGSRQWIEERLLGMEEQGLLDVTREYFPPHYHLALFPAAYLADLELEIGSLALAAALKGEPGNFEVVAKAIDEAPLATAGGASTTRRSIWSRLASVFGLRG